MALERKTNTARYQFSISLALGAIWVVVLLAQGDTRPVAWIPPLVWLLIAVAAVFPLRAARRDTRAFEQEHGSDAGIQRPIV